MACSKRDQTRGRRRLAAAPRRVLNAHERQKLTVDAWGLLAFLQEADLVRADELEEALLLIATLESGEVDAKELALVLSSVIADRDRAAIILWKASGRDGDDDAGEEDEEQDAGPRPRLLH
ncbi:MAG: DUF494 family protein [Firmicutes bacterium]|nr:DUF494 family protein [Bacillota bacterium]MDH7494925.1 DUF494 family protein [Bacillota bacterium]